MSDLTNLIRDLKEIPKKDREDFCRSLEKFKKTRDEEAVILTWLLFIYPKIETPENKAKFEQYEQANFRDKTPEPHQST